MVIRISAQNRINKKCITCSKVKLLKEFTLLKKYRASYCKDCNKLILIKSPKIIKKCYTCKKNKSLDKFTGSNGLKAFKVGLCIECRRITHSQWKKNNRDKVNQYHRKWKLENPEKYRKQRDRYQRKYADQTKKRQIEYREKNKEKIRKARREYYWNVIKKDPIKLKKNREQARLSGKLSRIKDPEKFRAQDREYYKKNRKKRIDSVMRWKEKHPERVLINQKNFSIRHISRLRKEYIMSDKDIKKKKTLW